MKNIQNISKKTKRQWIQSSLATVAILTPLAAGTLAHTMHVQADATTTTQSTDSVSVDYDEKAQDKLDDAGKANQEVVDDITKVSFKTAAQGLAGKWVTLKIDHVAQDKKDPSQYIDYVVRNVFVRMDSQGSRVASYVGNKTVVEITPRGDNNTVWLQVGNDSTGYKEIFRSTVKTESDFRANINTEAPNRYGDDLYTVLFHSQTLDTPQSYTLPNSITSDDLKLKAGYISNKQRNGATGSDVSIDAPIKLVRSDKALKDEIKSPLKTSDDVSDKANKAKKLLDETEKTLIDNIDHNNTLDKETKDRQKKQVHEDIQKAKDQADNEYVPDKILPAATETDQEKRHDETIWKPVLSDDERLQVAKNRLEEDYLQSTKAIKANDTLLDSEKTVRLKQLDEDHVKAQGELATAKTLDDIKAVMDAENQAFEKDNENVDRTKRNQEFFERFKNEADVQKVIDEITSDVNLTKTEKDDQMAVVTAAVNQMQQNIETAESAQKALDALNNAGDLKDKLAKAHQEAKKKLVDQVSDAKEKLRQKGEEAKKELDDSIFDKLTKDEKNHDKQAIDELVKKAQAADEINNPTNAQSLLDAVDQSDLTQNLTDLMDQEKAKPSVKDQIKKAQEALDNASKSAQKVLDEAKSAAEAGIDQNGLLTKEQKDKQKKAIEAAAKKAEDQISQATNADEINREEADLANDITGLTDKKKEARAEAEKVAKKQILDLNNNKGLSPDDREQRINKVKEDFNNVTDVIDSALPSDSKAFETGEGSDYAKQVQGDGYSDPDALEKAREKAKMAVDDAYKKAETALDGKKSAYTDAEFNKAKTDLDAQKQRDEKAAMSAEDWAGTDATTKAAGTHADEKKAAIDNVPSFDEQKQKAKAALAANQSKLDGDINGMDKLSGDEKKSATGKVDQSVKDAQDAVDKAQNKDELVQKAAEEKQKVDNDQQNVSADLDKIPSIDDQKQTAKNAIDKEAESKKDGIDQKDNLSTGEKSGFKEAVDQAANKAKQAIDGAQNKDELNNKGDAAKTDFGEDVQKVAVQVDEKPSLDKQKQDKKDAIDHKATVEKEKLDATNRPDLTDYDRKQKQDVIDKGAKRAKDSLDSATNADELAGEADKEASKSFDDAKDQVDDQFKNHESLDEQKNKLPDTVTPEEKEGAKTADDVNHLLPLSDKKQKLDDQVDHAADLHKKAIDGMDNVPQQDRDKAKDQIDDAVKKAKTAIDIAASDDKLPTGKGGEDDALSQFDSAVNGIVDGLDNDNKGLLDKKHQSETGIDDGAKQEKANIDKNKNLN
ncbi:DUF1542 domain-containing protein [Fructobacillus sp. M1-13]|uniref:DUF1542 domain-containing protein n=1 Tax=Fructobacillus papyriferae TaxID=2713171 RepID=A0ABS5QPD2_9LACO|nr:DUF1542 domain-containing protein [Fructobacillus papyriferae]MBS9334950.1 DUF1542 domain-containing protein [Fructobacillus papyriferae]MCD2159566.1 DUF1542 domain-containing protein [Fructobacillus papyriferae]